MISLLLTALLVTGDTAAATTQPTTAVVEAPKEERKICKREQVSTSLHGSKRVCLTARQWKARDTGMSAEDNAASVSTK